MATRRNYFFFFSFFIFLSWAGAAKEEDSPDCDAVAPYKCGEPAGVNCLRGSCYTFNITKKTWIDSKNACKEKPNSDLVSIETREELVFLQKRIENLNFRRHKEWYIGLSVDEPIWKWLSGKPLTINHWQDKNFIDSNEPSGDGDVVSIAKDYPQGQQGSFNDNPRSSSHASICEETNATKGKHCYNGSCYTFHEARADFPTSRRMCQRKSGSDIVSLETEDEWKYINGLLQNPVFPDEWHIGLERKSWKSWKWLNDATYSLNKNMWKDNRPRGTTPYAFMGIAKWPGDPEKIFSDAYTATEAKPYICETKLVYTPPT